METPSAESGAAALACYRQALRDGIAPLSVGSPLDPAGVDAFTATVLEFAAADGLNAERMWDPNIWGNAADPCPVIVIGRFGVAYALACERHAVSDN
jgi:hypothetical protein